MSQRKLMGALSIILLAFLFILVGCGDGKQNTKTRPNKKLAQGKVGPNNGANGAAKTGSSGGQNQKGGSNNLSLKVANLKNIDEALQSQLTGDSIDAHSLANGDYTLNSVLGHVKFMRVSGDEVAAVVSASVVSGSLNGQVSNKEGLIATDTDEGRTVEIPLSFRVKNGAIDLSQLVTTGYHSQLELMGGLQQELGSKNAAFNVMGSLNGSPNASGNYAVTLDGREAGIQIRKTSTGARLVLTITEKKAGTTTKQGDSTLIRTLVFTYSLKAEPTPARSAAPAEPTSPAPADTQGSGDVQFVQPKDASPRVSN